MSSKPRGRLFIVSAPSGTGKTTLCERLAQVVPGIRLSRSYTSRLARPGERDGVDYHFVSRQFFEAMIAEKSFLEWADVFGNLYGTSATDTEALLAAGEDVMLVIDVQGARQVRTRGIETVGIFVFPPSAQVLESRLRGRSKDSETQIRTRLDVARGEVGEFARYEYLVVNDDLDGAVNRLRAIILAERARVKSMRAEAESIIETFQVESYDMALITLGVTGGIGAYKAVEVCRGLQKAGHDVVAVMTRAATRFVGPMTFEAITRRPVITSQFAVKAESSSNARDIEHIAIADRAALLVVVPCTANVIGKFAHGIADDFLTSLYLATTAPVLLAPAMNTNMLAHPAVQENLRLLAARGVRFVDPGEGYLACGWMGKGRLAEPDAIVNAAVRLLAPVKAVLHGRRVLVTAGPTLEDIDPVRFVGNRSSGRMGFALAEEATRRGAEVILVAGPTTAPAPDVAHLVRVRSAADMHKAVMEYASDADLVIMAAAVADYTPGARAEQKVAKKDGPLTLTLTRTRDILADLGTMRDASGSRRPVLVGFAAETSDVVRKARDKRMRKHADLIVANDVSQDDRGFEVSTNAATLVSDTGEVDVPLQAKASVAEKILDAVQPLIDAVAKGRP